MIYVVPCRRVSMKEKFGHISVRCPRHCLVIFCLTRTFSPKWTYFWNGRVFVLPVKVAKMVCNCGPCSQYSLAWSVTALSTLATKMHAQIATVLQPGAVFSNMNNSMCLCRNGKVERTHTMAVVNFVFSTSYYCIEPIKNLTFCCCCCDSQSPNVVVLVFRYHVPFRKIRQWEGWLLYSSIPSRLEIDMNWRIFLNSECY